MNRVRTWGVGLVATIALGKPAPNLIPTSGVRAQGNDCYTLNLSTSPDFWSFYIQAKAKEGLSGLTFEQGVNEGTPGNIANEALADMRFMATHYLKGYGFRYPSPWRFLLAAATRSARITIAKDRFAQLLFNRRILVRHDRIRVLRFILEKTVVDRNYRATATGLMTEFLGRRWVRHPKHLDVQTYYELVLESLKASGALVVENHAYRIGPNGLVTLSEFDLEEQRHGDSHKIQIRISWFTWALVLLGALQLGASIWEELHPDPASETSRSATTQN